jgi:hypothetical protein
VQFVTNFLVKANLDRFRPVATYKALGYVARARRMLSMLRRNLPLCAAAVSVLFSLVPMRVRAQGPNANGLTGPTQSASDSSLTLADLENRRQQIVVSSMGFSNDEQKRKFLQVYVPYQIKLKQILAGKRKLIEEYSQKQQNGVISGSDANRILRQALALDNKRENALATYLRQLKSVVPEQQDLRAYQIENRIYALYMSNVTSTIPLVP